LSISYNYQTGQLICNANIKEVERFIKDEMGYLDRIHHGSRSQRSLNPHDDARRKNTNNARLRGIKNYEDWENAVNENKIEYWAYYKEDKTKVIPSPFKED